MLGHVQIDLGTNAINLIPSAITLRSAALHHFSHGEVDVAVVVPAERWPQMGDLAMAMSGEI